MSLDFCPNCSNLLTFTNTPERKLIQKCHSCNYPVNDISKVCVYYNKFVQNSYDTKLDPDQRYDNTLPYTDEIECLNPECPSHGYDLFVQRQLTELAKEMGKNEAEKEFEKRGGKRGKWLKTSWEALDAEEKATYKREANIRNVVKYLHYNSDMKLAYICYHCQTYWKN